ncbi:hypothetical protein O181_028236 [Austropuccinia psidii MF-1]|uniref:GAG-pre-integrase domain-containing protein n=1 Tax=Austropuccinia psidii MF-1 TaxID=1389203 RepID=A0A9Q3CNR9_9BASI|nr:hypothetical protein [Austropuccinia psidii MF-1]
MCNTHSKYQCYAKNPHLRPSLKNNKRKNQASAPLSTTQALITSNNAPSEPQYLIIDCGATQYMFSSQRYLTSFTKTPEINFSSVDLAGTLVSVGIGTFFILCGNSLLSLKNSLFFPRLNCNLVFLLALSCKKVSINREVDLFTLEINEKGSIKGKITNNPMRVEHSIPESYVETAPSNLWHKRLGHPGKSTIKLMELPIINPACSTFNLNKIHMLRLNKHFGYVIQPLELSVLNSLVLYLLLQFLGFYIFST